MFFLCCCCTESNQEHTEYKVATPKRESSRMDSTVGTAAARAEHVREREKRIGICRSLVDMCLAAEGQPVLENPMVSLKELCSDFVVREISQTTTNALFLEAPLPTPAAVGGVAAGQKRSRQQRDVGGAPPSTTEGDDDNSRATEIHAAFDALITADEVAALIAMVAHDDQKTVIASVTEKPKRALIHAAVKQCFAGTHISTTENGSVVVVKATAADRREERRRSNPLRTRPYLHFTLYKENMDSTYAFRALAKSLHVSSRQFQFCGTKDKRAVTLQRVAIRDMAPARLAAVNEHTYGHSKMKVCSFSEEPEGLRLGDALGNRFEIVLRCAPATTQHGGVAADDTTDAPAAAAVVLESWLAEVQRCLSTVGTVNYYGPQRFGTTKVLTSDVGLSLLRGEFEEALYQCFESKSCFTPDVVHTLAPLRARHYDEVLEKLPHFCFQERDMVKHLITSPNDYMGAFLTLPRTLAMLYFHAVQSLAWNTMASARLTDASRLRPEVGDLVLEEVYKLRVQNRDSAPTPVDVTSKLREGDQALPAVTRLSASDPLDCFALSDVLLPVPGPDDALQFPTSLGCGKAEYQATLAAMGVQEALLPADPNAVADIRRTNALIKVFHFHGTYRPLCLVPTQVSLKRTVVSGWRAPANVTDLEKIEPPAVTATSVPTAETPCECIVAGFSLPAGSYATSVLREFAVLSSEGLHGGSGSGTVAETEADGEEADDTLETNDASHN